ncbi:MAG: HAD family phosphatase [Clostridiales bacterium]|nr:HAD family phosphatase [Clostridiales bacterium]
MTAQPFKRKILVSDLDATLLDSNRKISRENIRAIERFRAGGGLFTIATGRMFGAVEPYLKELQLDMPAVVLNGAAIYDFNEKRILWKHCLPYSIKDTAEKILESFPGIGFEVLQDRSLYVVRSNGHVEKHVGREGFAPVYISSLDELEQPWFKILLAWDPEKLPAVEAFIDEILKKDNQPYRHVYSEPNFLELLNSEASKGAALERLMSMYGYDTKNVIAVGDNMNDMEMLQTAAVGIAVENANPALKEVAGLICRSNDENALEHVVEMLGQGLF